MTEVDPVKQGRVGWGEILRRLWWDLLDRHERAQYGYWLIWQVPGEFGNLLRGRYLGPRMRRAGTNLRVFAGCRFRSLERLEIGDNVSLGHDNFIQALGGLTIGSDVATGPGVKVWSVNHGYAEAEAPVVDQEYAYKPVHIADNVFIGSNAFIMPGVQLPEGCVVAAGSVVGAKPYPPYSLLAGNPARVIGYRDGHAPSAGRGGQDHDAPVPPART